MARIKRFEQKYKYKADAIINQQKELRARSLFQKGAARIVNSNVAMHNIFILWWLYLKTNFGANIDTNSIAKRI